MARRARKMTSGRGRAAASRARVWRARAANTLREVVRIVNRGWATPEDYVAFEDELIKAAVAAVQDRTFAEALEGPLTKTVWYDILAKLEWGDSICPRCGEGLRRTSTGTK
jgi:hypothetical protein